jgi:oligopeptidase B
MLNTSTTSVPHPPRIARRDSIQIAHGTELVDPYAWLRADNWQEVLRDPAVLPDDIRAVLEAENAYADAVLSGTGDLRRMLQAEMRARI